MKRLFSIFLFLTSILYITGKQSINQEETKDTTLIKAIKTKNFAQIQRLLNLGKDPNQQNALYFSPLIIATKQGSINIVRILLQNEKTKPNMPDDLGNTALIYAVQDNNLPIIKLLLQYGADVNHMNDAGFTPLMIAAENKTRETISTARTLLAKANINPMIKNHTTNVSAAHIAAKHCNWQIALDIINHPKATLDNKEKASLLKVINQRKPSETYRSIYETLKSQLM